MPTQQSAVRDEAAVERSSHQEMVKEFSGPPSTIAADAAWSARAQPPRAGEPIIRNPDANCVSAFGSVTIGSSNRNVLEAMPIPFA